MTFKGNELKIGRPKQFQDAESEMNKSLALDQFNPILAAAQGITNSLDQTNRFPFRVYNPSKVLELKNIITFALSNRFDTCRTVYFDVKQRCLEFGNVLSIQIPRPVWLSNEQREEKLKALAEGASAASVKKVKKRGQKEEALEPIDDETYFSFPPGFGSVFVEFETVEGAVAARSSLDFSQYAGRTIQASFFSQTLFQRGIFADLN